MNVVVLASGRGSNLRALVQAVEAGDCAARIAAVVSDRSDAEALAFAQERAISTAAVPYRKGDDRDAWNVSLADTVAGFAPELVVFAGFMRVVGSPFVQRFPGRILNIHPALLPSFPGVRAPAQAIEAGVRLSGCTVHVVDEGVDTGPIVAQAAVPVHPDDDPDTLHERIRKQEHDLLPRVVDWVARGMIELGPSPRISGSVSRDDRHLVAPRFEGDRE